MRHWKTMFDPSEFLFAHDLNEKEVIVQIEKVAGGEIKGERGKKNKKPMLSFVGKKKRLALNKTNAKCIAKMYSDDVDEWVGKWIAIYPTTTEFGGETVACIRVRPRIPAGKPGPTEKAEQLLREQAEREDAKANAPDSHWSEDGEFLGEEGGNDEEADGTEGG